ncbi:MAG: 4Fe-4S dicluster domain-containing protein [Nitrospirae bacterium]|nr:4Fe-4S dicluster domain-containing protein [Nitrospirota bacterium]
MKYLFCNLEKCLGCKSCEIACALEHSRSKDLFQAVEEKPSPRYRLKVEYGKERAFPLACRHCDEPACVVACMSGCLSKDSKTGAVVQDEERCVGCWMCLMVCPYGAVNPDGERKLPLRCDRCREKEEPACVVACPTGALVFMEPEEFKKTVTRNSQPVTKKTS